MADTPQKAKRKRRWLTYSLRTFFLIVTVACVAFGVWANSAAKQKAAVEWVKKSGGECWYDFEVDENLQPVETPERPYTKWAHALLGDDYFATVASVTVFSDGLEDIEPLAALDQLRYLRVSGVQVRDLTPLAKMHRLKVLYMPHTLVSDLAPLAGLASLEELWIERAPVSDLTPLANLTRLEYLHLYDTQVSDLTPLAGLTRLKFLDVSNTQVSDLTPLANLTCLEHLNLGAAQELLDQKL